MNGAAKEADLVVAAFLYVSRCARDGDRHALRQMNVGSEEINAIRRLTVDDILRALPLGAHCLRIRVDRDAFWQLVSRLDALRERDRLLREFIAADAPGAMMTELFGLGRHEYTVWRRLYGLPNGAGRPVEPDEATERAIWRACEAHVGETGKRPLDASDYLEIARCCEAALRTVWRVLERWRQAAKRDPTELAATLTTDRA